AAHGQRRRARGRARRPHAACG
ncbi:MAG: hypothetical protein AVDCRST_MAG35-3167, partial [uncultured Quadrisphaera sp.]